MSTGQIKRNEVYAAFIDGNDKHPIIVKGARIIDEPRRFARAKPYQPTRAERFRFEDGEALDGIDAADRVRAHGYVGKLCTGMITFQTEEVDCRPS